MSRAWLSFRAASGYDRALAIVFLTTGLLTLLVTIYASVASYLLAPYSDPHKWIADVFIVQRNHDYLAYLWAEHTQQRIPIARLAQLIDTGVGSGRLRTFLVATWLFQSVAVLAVFTAIARSRLGFASTCSLLGITLALGFNVTAVESFAFPVFSVYTFVAGSLICALVAFEHGDCSHRSWVFFAVSCFAGVMASAGNAAGLVTWPVLIFWCHARGRSKLETACMWAIGAACIAVFEFGLKPPSSGSA